MRVLIIEDNDTDYLLAERQLRKCLNPDVVGRAASRTELFDALTQPWQLVIADGHLPTLEGDELLQAVAVAQPGTPCLLLTGSAPARIPATVDAVVEKGDHAALREALRQLQQRVAGGS